MTNLKWNYESFASNDKINWENEYYYINDTPRLCYFSNDIFYKYFHFDTYQT